MLKPIEIKAQGERAAEVYLYDVIGEVDENGDGLTAKGFSEALDALAPLDTITVRINSPGGSVMQGLAIYNALARNPAKVVAEIDGVAGSAASFVAMAADEIRIAENGEMFIHNAQALAIGDKVEMGKTAALLDKMDHKIAAMYAKRSGKSPASFLDAMKDETWYGAKEAVAAKLADSIIGSAKVAAKFDSRILNRLSKRPEKIAAFCKPPKAGDAPDDGRWAIEAAIQFTESPTNDMTEPEDGEEMGIGDRVCTSDGSRNGTIREMDDGPAYGVEFDDDPGTVDKWHASGDLSKLDSELEEEGSEGDPGTSPDDSAALEVTARAVEVRARLVAIEAEIA